MVGFRGSRRAALALIGSLTMVGAANADPARRAERVTLEGTIRSLRVAQMEPAETPQATFFLDVRPAGGKPYSVLVERPTPIPCFEGDRARIEGDLSLDGVGGPVLLDARIVECRRAE